MSFINPSPLLCWEVNPSLWDLFSTIYKSHNNVRPYGDWTEEDVVYWLDNIFDDGNKKRRYEELEQEYDFLTTHELGWAESAHER